MQKIAEYFAIALIAAFAIPTVSMSLVLAWALFIKMIGSFFG